MDKEAMVHILEHYSATRKNEIMPFVATWMSLETTIICEVNQEKTNTISLICGI